MFLPALTSAWSPSCDSSRCGLQRSPDMLSSVRISLSTPFPLRSRIVLLSFPFLFYSFLLVHSTFLSLPLSLLLAFSAQPCPKPRRFFLSAFTLYPSRFPSLILSRLAIPFSVLAASPSSPKVRRSSSDSTNRSRLVSFHAPTEPSGKPREKAQQAPIVTQNGLTW